MSDNYIQSFQIQPGETQYDEKGLPLNSSKGSTSSGKLSSGLGNSSMLSSKLIRSRSCNSQLNSIDAINRQSASLENAVSTPCLHKRSGLMSTISTSLKKVSGFFDLRKLKSSENISTLDGSASANRFTDSNKSLKMNSGNFDCSTPSSSTRKVRNVQLDANLNRNIASGFVNVSNNLNGSKLINRPTESFRSVKQKRNIEDKDRTSFGRSVKKIKLDNNGRPSNRGVAGSYVNSPTSDILSDSSLMNQLTESLKRIDLKRANEDREPKRFGSKQKKVKLEKKVNAMDRSLNGSTSF